jgi:hypothetical protein
VAGEAGRESDDELLGDGEEAMDEPRPTDDAGELFELRSQSLLTVLGIIS